MLELFSGGIGLLQKAMTYSPGRNRMVLKHMVTLKSVELLIKLLVQHYSNDVVAGILTG